MKHTPNIIVISVDPGEKVSGLSIIMLNRESLFKKQLIGFNIDNASLVSKITEYYVKYNCFVVIEDIRPYRQQLTLQLVATCKFIGELNYRLINELKTEIQYITRGQVKKWIFGQFNDVSVEKINKRIAYLDGYGEKRGGKRYRNKDGGIRMASFHWVDDRVVISAMKELWNIPTPKPGKSNMYGFSSHSWQALAVGSCFLYTKFGYDFHELVQS